MKGTIVFLVLLAIPHCLFIYGSFYRGGHLRNLAFTCGIAACLYVLGLVATVLIMRLRRGSPQEVAVGEEAKDARILLAREVAVVLTGLATLVFVMDGALRFLEWANLPRAVRYLSGAAAFVSGVSFLAAGATARWSLEPRERAGPKRRERVRLPLIPKILGLFGCAAAALFIGGAAFALSLPSGAFAAVHGVSGVAAVLCGLAFLRIKAARRCRGQWPQVGGRANGGYGGSIFSPRVIVVVAATVAGEYVALVTSSVLGSFAIAEGAYYTVLIGSGAVLATWCKAEKYVPVLAGTLTLLALSAAQTFTFLRNPGARFQFGPEISIFAIENHVSRMNMLPLDAVVALSSWRIASAVTGRKLRRAGLSAHARRPLSIRDGKKR